MALRQDSIQTSGRPLGPDLRSGPILSDAWQHIQKALRLSDRELRIVQEIYAGQEHYGSIALAIGVAPEVVYRSIQQIYVKLRIGSKLELKSRVMLQHMAFAAIEPELSFRA